MKNKEIFYLKNFFLFLVLIFSIISEPLNANRKVLKVGAIPDQNQDLLYKRFNLLSKELSKSLNVDVKYIPVISYVAAISGFRTNDLDLVWFGGLSAVILQAGTPTAISTILMAEAYGVKQKIASKILFTTTLISIITIPLLKMFMDLFIQTT